MSYNETGHYKNVTALEKMIQKAIALGTSYNPSKAKLSLTSLQALLAQAKTDYDAVAPNNIPFNNAVNQRLDIFKPYKTFSTQILAAFKTSSDATKQTIKDLTTINKKIQGARATKKELTATTDPNRPAPETISASQQSYDMKYDHFVKYTELIQSETTYLPNESELDINAIIDYRDNLLIANQNVANTFEAVNQARIKRDNTLYNDTTGVYAIQDLVKEYIKGVFGATSIQYRQMVAIKFNKPKKLFI